MRYWCLLCLFLLTAVRHAPAQDAKQKAADLYEKGEKALANKEYFKAQAHYNECLRLDPRFAEAYRSRAIAREHLGEPAKALTDFNIYVDLRPTDAEALFNRAVLRYDAKQYLPARQDFLKLLTMPPGETNTVYYSQEKYSNANTKVFTAQGGAKDHLYNYLGQIETHLKRYAIAISWLDSAIRLAPTVPGYWVNRGLVRVERGDKAGATADYEQALKLDPEHSLALHNLAALKSISGDKESAEKLLSESIEKNAKLPYPRAERGYQRLQNNDLKGALEDYNEVVRLEPNVDENHINRGLVKEKLKDLHGALNDYSKAIQLHDKNPKSWLCHGNVESKLGRWTEAIDDYSVAISLDPDYGPAFYNRAIAYHNVGKGKEACDDLKSSGAKGIKESESMAKKICK